jgi:dTDP-4-dehydrorhamnose reductase
MTKGQRPKILIFGKNGQIGFELCRSLSYLGNLTALGSVECDITDPHRIIDTLDHIKPDIIVNAAAYTAVDKAESECELAFKINADAPWIMAEWASKYKALMVHFSTDYVFDGTKETPYTEEDKPAPLNVYGESKLAGDINIQNSRCDHLIFRTSWVYGTRGKNFYLTMQKLLREKEEIRVVNDQYGAPTRCRTIAGITALVLMQYISNRELENKDVLGVYNLTNSGKTTWYGFAKAIREKKRLENKSLKLADIIPISSKEYPAPARRPENSLLSCEKLQKVFGIKTPGWKEPFSSL